MRVSIFEIFLFQIILYSGLWLIDEFVATFMCISMPIIVLVILVVSLIAEWIEPSRISKKYFWVMGISVVVPIVVGLAFYVLYEGRLDWFEV